MTRRRTDSVPADAPERAGQPPLPRRSFLARTGALGAGLVATKLALPQLLHALDAASVAPGRAPRPGDEELPASADAAASDLTLSNDVILAMWSASRGRLRLTRVVDRARNLRLDVAAAPFTLALADGSTLAADQMEIVGAPRIETLAAQPRASRRAEQLGGRRISATLRDRAGRLEAEWRAILRDGSRYVRQEVTLRAQGQPLPVKTITLVDLHAPGAKVTGTVKGSPVVAGAWFVGFEHPLSEHAVDAKGRATGVLGRELPLRPGAPFTVSSVIGTTRPGQLRRDFLGYVERERAHPYRPFLHYNTWYDIGYFGKYSEPEALAVIGLFGRELHEKRNVVLSSFLFDDGWDDAKTLWGFHDGFPDGFTKVRETAARYGAAPGVWMSPWGGYGQPRKDRLENGKAQGFEINEGGFMLSGPKYYARFRDTCLKMVREYGVNQFKFDGTGNASSAFPGSIFDSDFDAAINLIGELRTEKPDIYINLTTGTYPSPFWLRWADSIWRGGEDHSFAGVGPFREQWITYRDGDVHEHVVGRGELYPLNSLMLHGLIYARHAKNLDTDPHRDFPREVRDYFGTGTQLQEMYVTPTLLDEYWDAIAEAARWSRANADTLVDTHWIGGDPQHLEPYGWASWSPAKGILVLRNPSDQPRRMEVDVRQAFELPDGAPTSFAASSPWQTERGKRAPIRLTTAAPYVAELQPFEVVTLEATAVE